MFDAPTPADPRAFTAALQARDPIRAAAVARAMLAARVPLGRQWQAVARFAAAEAEWTLALGAARAFVAAAGVGGGIAPRLFLAEITMNAGRVGEAVTQLRVLAGQAPGDAGVLHFLGVALIEAGARAEGVERLRAALALRPGSGPTWAALANAERPASGLVDALRQAETACRAASPDDHAAWAYAMGAAWDAAGEHARAFDAFAAGARIVANQRPYDGAADRAAALATIAGLEPAWLEAHATDGPTRALFVTGKPRSGTTLVAQLLAAHSRVGGAGEIGLLPRVAGATRLVTADDLRRQAGRGGRPWSLFHARYAHGIAEQFGAGDTRVVDKSLDTSRHAAALRLAMPDAPVIWLRRDPLDTAWSSFRTLFARGLGWSFDLAAMGRYHALEDRLHAFWAETYGGALMTLSYRDLVDDPEAHIPRILAHCGLADEAGVRTFHKGGGAVQTASVGQVRRPINRAGLDTAAPYRERLAPYLKAYDEARRALGLPQFT